MVLPILIDFAPCRTTKSASAPLATAGTGSISSDQDERRRSTPGECQSVTHGSCAVLYGKRNCEGWSINIPSGTHDLQEDYRNDAEVVVVKAGCKFIGKSRLVFISLR